MKYSDIVKHTAIEKGHLDPNHYTLSLLGEACKLGLINQEIVDNVQTQIMSLLKELILRYTKGKSTSVKVETSQRILLSIMYSVDAAVSSASPEDAIECLKTVSIREIYEKGQKLLELCLTETRQLYRKIDDRKMDIQIKAYRATVDEALPGFFDDYDIIFNAHDTMASIDYPLVFDDMNIQGIYYIKQYMEKLEIETQFCSLFAKEDIEKLLIKHGQIYQIDYREALINIFEILITNCIFSVLSANKANELSISPSQHLLLQEEFKKLDHIQCASIISKAIETMIVDLNIEQHSSKAYIRKFKSLLIPRFINAMENNSLANVIMLDGEEDELFEMIFYEGDSMNNESFSDLIEEIMLCPSTRRKTEIISSSIHSLGDFIDVLEADCLFDDEYIALFNTLGDIELSVLARIVFVEELRSDSSCFSLTCLGEKPMEMEWHTEYARFLHSLSADRVIAIEKYLQAGDIHSY